MFIISNCRFKMRQTILAAMSMAASICLVNAQQVKTSDANITSQQIITAYQQHGAVKQHARLFFNDADIKRLQQLLNKKDPVITIGYNNLKKEANAILKTPLLTYHLDAAKLRVPSVHNFAKQLPALVMMYKLTNDTVYASRIWQQFKLLAEFPDWGANRHFLDAGIGAFNFALVYDALYDYLTPEQRAVLKLAVNKHVFIPGKAQLQKRIWWSVADHNWNGICNGGIIMAALAMFEDDPVAMSELVALAANGLPHYIHSFEPDGQSEEGLMYWSYGLMYTSIAFESMIRTLGTTFSLDEAPGFKKTGWFPLHVSGPVTSLSFGDDPVKDARSRSFFWFAKRNNDSALAKLQYDLCIETNNATWMDMVYYDPGMITEKDVLAAMPKDAYVRGIDVMSLRENWNKNAWFISLHGGRNNANHGHLDAGSFDIQGNGEVWAYGDLGRDDYTYPGYFTKTTSPGYNEFKSQQDTPGRWHFYRLRAEGKNCIVINPSLSPDQNEMGAAKLIKQASSPQKGFYVIDLSECYSRDVKQYQRGISLNRMNKVLQIQDDIVANKSSDIWWSMHTKAAIEIIEKGRVAVLKQNGKVLYAKILSPANASFSVLPATYLPGQSFPLTVNTENKGFSKLAVHLTNVENTIVNIVFSEDEKQIHQQIQTTSLSDWK